MSEPTLSFEAEVRELEPTAPDERGDRWRRVEATGRARWSCSCGDGSEMIAREVANQEALTHYEMHNIESAAPDVEPDVGEPILTLSVESRDLEPDAQGWARREETGRAWWSCSCGESCSLKPKAEAVAEFRAHADVHGLAV